MTNVLRRVLGRVRRAIYSPPSAQQQTDNDESTGTLRTFKENAWKSDASAKAYVVNTSSPSVGMLMEEDHVVANAHGWILDVGAGTGRFSRKLAAAGRPVVAVDISQSMLDSGRAISSHPYICCPASAFELPFVDGCFDSVISFWFLLHFEDWSALLAEMARVLRPGGRLIIEVMNREHLDAATAISPQIQMAVDAQKKASFTVWKNVDEVKALLKLLDITVGKVIPYDLFTENAIAQATLGENYREWLAEVRKIQALPECIDFWRRFDQIELPKLPAFFGRRFILLCDKAGPNQMPISAPEPPPQVPLSGPVARSIELFQQAYDQVYSAKSSAELFRQ